MKVDDGNYRRQDRRRYCVPATASELFGRSSIGSCMKVDDGNYRRQDRRRYCVLTASELLAIPGDRDVDDGNYRRQDRRRYCVPATASELLAIPGIGMSMTALLNFVERSHFDIEAAREMEQGRTVG